MEPHCSFTRLVPSGTAAGRHWLYHMFCLTQSLPGSHRELETSPPHWPQRRTRPSARGGSIGCGGVAGVGNTLRHCDSVAEIGVHVVSASHLVGPFQSGPPHVPHSRWTPAGSAVGMQELNHLLSTVHVLSPWQHRSATPAPPQTS